MYSECAACVHGNIQGLAGCVVYSMYSQCAACGHGNIHELACVYVYIVSALYVVRQCI